MSALSLLLLSLASALGQQCLAQQPSHPDTSIKSPNDTLISAARRDSLVSPKQQQAIQLVSASSALTAVTENLRIAARSESGTDNSATLKTLTEKQGAAIRLTGQFARAYATGAAARVSILDNLSFGLSFASAASPFVSKTFDDSYVKTTHYLKAGSALLGVVGALLFSKDGSTRLAILGGGVGGTALIDLFRQSDSHVAKQAASGFAAINSTIDLFDFNRLVYNDILRLNGMVAVARNTDSVLTGAMKAFAESPANQALLLVDSDSMSTLPGFCTYITSAESLFVRLQPLVAQVNNIYETAESMVKAYQLNGIVADSGAQPSLYATDVKQAIGQLAKGLRNSQDSWATLQALLIISPSDIRQLNAFYELQDIKEAVAGKSKAKGVCLAPQKT
ncbi:MAG: hypothetical protein ACREND_08420 [Gemmatimonadaceae bacterium]